jgi:hypothetical protein
MAVFLVCVVAGLILGDFVLAIRDADRLQRERLDSRERHELGASENERDSGRNLM